MALRITAAALVGLTLVIGLLIAGRANALTGTIAGHSFALGGSVGSVTLGPLNLVTLPPGGGSNVPLGASEPPVVANSASASTSCSGNATGPQVDATCSAEVNGLSLSVSAVELVTATVIRAQSNSVDAGAGQSSNNTGTLFSGLCIQQTLVGPCTPVSSPGPVSVNLPGVVIGTIDVQVEVPRTMEGAVAGSGLTVTMLQIELTTPLISIVMDIAEADSFVGGVTADTPTPTPSATPTPTLTASPSPTPSDTPTPTTSPPTPSDTPTPTASPSPTPSDTPTPTTSPLTPSDTPTPTASPSPTPSDTPTPTTSPSPTPTPSEPPSPSPASTLGLTTTPSPAASATPGPTNPPSATPTLSPTPMPTRPAAPPAQLPPAGTRPPDAAGGDALYLAIGLAAALASALHLHARCVRTRRAR